MIEVLIEEELYDEAFVRDWCVGFAELKSMCQHYRPEVTTLSMLSSTPIKNRSLLNMNSVWTVTDKMPGLSV